MSRYLTATALLFIVFTASAQHTIVKNHGKNDIAPVGIVKNISDSTLLDIVQRQTFRYF